MIVCFNNNRITINRLLIYIFLSSICTVIKAETVSNFSKSNYQTQSNVCVAEIVNKTLFYNSVGYRVFAGALIVPITICAICGNVLVIYVIKRYRSLRGTGNVFLASLAVADVGVSSVAMTFYGLQLLYGRWLFGPFMCRLWFSCDVLFSTASIIHLACIALDRYLSIVRPFEHQGSFPKQRRYVMIFFCWLVSALLSFIPIFTGIYATPEQRLKINCLKEVHGRCEFAVNQVYAIVSSSFSFWVPGTIMIIMYIMLIRIADKKEREMYEKIDAVKCRRRASQQNYLATCRRSSEDQAMIESLPMTQLPRRASRLSATNTSVNNGHSNHVRPKKKRDSLQREIDRHASIDLPNGTLDPRNSHMTNLKRERRAVKTLGSVMLAFIICWLPFFVRYTACEPNRCNWKIGPFIADIVFWVGYFNSMINPFLYAFHNREFRSAFRKTLTRYFICCRERRTSIASSIGIQIPSTSNDETRRSSDTRTKWFKTNRLMQSITHSKDQHDNNRNNLSITLPTGEISNGTVSAIGNSLSSQRNPFV